MGLLPEPVIASLVSAVLNTASMISFLNTAIYFLLCGQIFVDKTWIKVKNRTKKNSKPMFGSLETS
jgi:hypothetical protein